MPLRLTCSSLSVPNSPQQRSLSSFLPEHTPFNGSLAPPPTTIPITTLSQCVICPNSSHRSLLCHLILICYSFSKVSSPQWTQTRKSPTSAKTRTCKLDLSTKKPNTPFAAGPSCTPSAGVLTVPPTSGPVSVKVGLTPHQRRQCEVRTTKMLPSLQRKYLFRKLLQPFKGDKQQPSSGDSQRGKATCNGLPGGLVELSGAQTVLPSMKMSFCIENVGPGAFLTTPLPSSPPPPTLTNKQPGSHIQTGLQHWSPAGYPSAHYKSTWTALMPRLPPFGLHFAGSVSENYNQK
ncbi:uncharacterized protein LOC117018358 [Rhinolophus ferrumequinum]|uniref:uncharacterized protein LOC117018358 n=1 Tax=Rhinolophus ferrumequinum TaxID=59479 RepID=UPI00140F5AC2|nr:uncharacterized protein LOC117018358 [Rhinolophus ferrumequinum]